MNRDRTIALVAAAVAALAAGTAAIALTAPAGPAGGTARQQEVAARGRSVMPG
ncbi:hypothetical protein PS9374_05706 [Planomonospora sphaerica]|uniref:Uncharacterized protein n=1 Tax=Planomonospora sphaerica TaxID=161355 RepID=A0A161LR42_9ACTN|nr:hypothetical protein [Planomonospora sphaerica]GAT70026.1 hypothetical protein PS9374_05706 [Planomonospora sphaerica]